jgi:phosphohistidine phosphatase
MSPVELFLLRHGIAEDAPPGKSDADRALTAEGIRKLRSVLTTAHRAGLNPSLILTSPLRRAVETADVAIKVLAHKREPIKTRVLIPESNPQDVWDEVRVYRVETQLLLVGHEPLFSQVTAHLLDSLNLSVDFKKGAIVRIDLDTFGPKPKGILRWFLTPRLASE